MSLYIYGVVGASGAFPDDLRGVGDPPGAVRRLPAGAVAAAVGPAPDRLRARRRDLQAHQEVLLALGEAGPVLPMRFGVVADDEESVRARLDAASDGHLAALDRIAGRVEMNVRATPVDQGLADIVRTDPQVRRLREEARRRPGYEVNVRLGEAVAAAVTRRAVRAAGDVLAALAGPDREVSHGPEQPGWVLNASFLVPSDGVAAFRAEVDRLAALHGDSAALQVTGPLPCYSFAMAPEPVAV
ncbi:GvpL/GvpF family gas vesicle protein [Actinacidiphila acidipaludis]|uniref:GvpL/GvpF family gas vesicle protein n=1 Tax=Actinacidiphila acidipaludis TaxID=2873382 RepID=A0ABS7PZ40_9ACTN|nr:GvpL/GvpF family gas vesicle protein [Streptomyces acidipaludis]MBY8876111.1 GvpL/GvpF family gas vesicle protein [Streptomyces acidipaludis]